MLDSHALTQMHIQSVQAETNQLEKAKAKANPLASIYQILGDMKVTVNILW
jgi:hypothetical protein